MTLDLPLILGGVVALGVAIYVLLDGIDLGVGILLPIARDDGERDLMVNSIAPFWDGNETWLVLGGALLYGAFPLAYATLLPALYIPVVLMLFALVFRGVAFEFRFKSVRARHLWDYAFAGGSLVAAFAQGAMLGAFVRGFPIENGRYIGGAWDWLGGYNALTGLGLVAGYMMLAGGWLIWKTDGATAALGRAWARRAMVVVLVAMGIVSLATPFTQPVVFERWFVWPNIALLAPFPLVTAACAWGAWKAFAAGDEHRPLMLTGLLFVMGYIGLAITMWPWIIPRAHTIHQAAADAKALELVAITVAVVLPVVVSYTIWNFWVFRGKTARGAGYH
jgi:cytochrome d ubiquinol oxidase subunit II